MGILKEKTVLYVTHQVEFLPAADLILVRETAIYITTQMQKKVLVSIYISLCTIPGDAKRKSDASRQIRRASKAKHRF